MTCQVVGILLGVLAIACTARAEVKSVKVLADSNAYFPQLSDDGNWLLFSSWSGRQLYVRNLLTGVERQVSGEGYPGYDAIWGADGKVYYVTQERKSRTMLLHRSVHCYDPVTGKSRRVLKGQHGRVQVVRSAGAIVACGERRTYRSHDHVGTYVYTRDTTLCLVDAQGSERHLHPVSGSNGYLWASLSPDSNRVLFEAASRGLFICDLQGNVLQRFGTFSMPCWYNDQYIVAMSNDGNRETASDRIWLLSTDGRVVQPLSPDGERAMMPMVAAGSIVYATKYAGEVKQLTLDIPAAAPPAVPMRGKAKTVNVAGASHKDAPRVYINPGHGGHDSDDRHMPTYVMGVGDTLHYYESNSNLAKGLALQQILRAKGYETAISRVTNLTADDLDLFEIVALAANSGADVFFAIHSNATGTQGRVNFPLGLYRGWDDEEAVEGNRALSDAVMKHLGECQATVWTDAPRSRGDWSFYDWGYRVGLGVLRYNKLPGMLSEGAFHDYLPERERLFNDDYCWLEAWNQSLGIDDYFKRKGKNHDGGVIAGVVRLAGTRRDDIDQRLYGADTLRTANGAVVSLLDPKGITVSQYTVDNKDNGVFVFRRVPAGNYNIQVTYRGVTTSSGEVRVRNNQSSYQNFIITQ